MKIKAFDVGRNTYIIIKMAFTNNFIHWKIWTFTVSGILQTKDVWQSKGENINHGKRYSLRWSIWQNIEGLIFGVPLCTMRYNYYASPEKQPRILSWSNTIESTTACSKIKPGTAPLHIPCGHSSDPSVLLS